MSAAAWLMIKIAFVVLIDSIDEIELYARLANRIVSSNILVN